MTRLNGVIDREVAIWNGTDPARRDPLARTWTADAVDATVAAARARSA
jgi:hypothetical protein